MLLRSALDQGAVAQLEAELDLVLFDRSGRLRINMPYTQAFLIEELARMYHTRYGVPLAISETATKGSINAEIIERAQAEATRRDWDEPAGSVLATSRARRSSPPRRRSIWSAMPSARWAA